MREKCKKHPGVELIWLAGAPAHPSNQYCPLCDAYESIAQWRSNYAELEAKLAEAERIVADAPELNMSNYDHDQVCRLNNAMNEVWQLLWANEAIDAAREDKDG